MGSLQSVRVKVVGTSKYKCSFKVQIEKAPGVWSDEMYVYRDENDMVPGQTYTVTEVVWKPQAKNPAKMNYYINGAITLESGTPQTAPQRQTQQQAPQPTPPEPVDVAYWQECYTTLVRKVDTIITKSVGPDIDNAIYSTIFGCLFIDIVKSPMWQGIRADAKQATDTPESPEEGEARAEAYRKERGVELEAGIDDDIPF